MTCCAGAANSSSSSHSSSSSSSSSSSMPLQSASVVAALSLMLYLNPPTPNRRPLRATPRCLPLHRTATTHRATASVARSPHHQRPGSETGGSLRCMGFFVACEVV